jgi:hypothetical protein
MRVALGLGWQGRLNYRATVLARCDLAMAAAWTLADGRVDLWPTRRCMAISRAQADAVAGAVVDQAMASTVARSRAVADLLDGIPGGTWSGAAVSWPARRDIPRRG